MDTKTIIRAWRDPKYRASLSNEDRAALPECPSGPPLTELDEGELRHVSGGLMVTAVKGCISVHPKHCPQEVEVEVITC